MGGLHSHFNQHAVTMNRAFVPLNLDMTLFGDKADKIALILDRLYRTKIYSNDYGRTKRKRDFTEPFAISMKHLREVRHENATPLMDMICYSQRHKDNGTQPIKTVLKRVRPAKKDVQAASYVLTKEYRVKPKIHIIKRKKGPQFKYDKESMEKMIAEMPPNYQKVCEHIKALSLEMDEEHCEKLIEQMETEYIEADKFEFVCHKVAATLNRYPNADKDIVIAKAATLWEEQRPEHLARLAEKHYDSLLFVHDKFLEMEGRAEMPVYSLDEQGRLHYYLTNMSEEMRPYIRLGGCKMVSYDLGTSQCVFVWVTLREYISNNNITLDDVKEQADEILATMSRCGDGTIPEYVQEELDAQKRKRSEHTLDDEMEQLAKLLSKDFYNDIMETIDWKCLSDGSFDRRKFKEDVLFPFLYGIKPTWGESRGKERITMMQYFLKKFPAIYCVLWKMRQFTEICLEYDQMIKSKIHPLAVLDHITEKYKTAEFPKEMQRQEANMFFNVIIPQIDQPFVILHDSIIVQDGKKCSVREIIEQVFIKQFGIKVCVKRESWSK